MKAAAWALASIVLPLLITEFTELGPWLAERLVRRSVRLGAGRPYLPMDLVAPEAYTFEGETAGRRRAKDVSSGAGAGARGWGSTPPVSRRFAATQVPPRDASQSGHAR